MLLKDKTDTVSVLFGKEYYLHVHVPVSSYIHIRDIDIYLDLSSCLIYIGNE